MQLEKLFVHPNPGSESGSSSIETTSTRMSAISQQLQEIQLLQSSLLPGELLLFKSLSRQWEPILKDFSENQVIPAEELPPAHFVIKVQDALFWLDIEFCSSYPKKTSVSIKGDVSKIEQIEWASFIHEKTLESIDTE